MFAKIVTLAGVIAASSLVVDVVYAAENECYLLTSRTSPKGIEKNFLKDDKTPYAAKKPFPSLTQCYKFNTKACCVSGHDHQISEVYQGMLSPTCVREFAELEYYMCLGCNDNQPDYVVTDANTNKMTVNICKKFADKLWTNNPRMYDSCGLNIKPSGSGFSNSDFILPSRYYNNASEFLNDVKPPYFDSFDINIVPSDDDTKCLDSSATRLGASLLFALVISLIHMM